jgi:hypothetical protein
MRTFVVTVAAVAALLAAGALTNRADAMTLGSGLHHAIEDTDLTDKVHCRWGYPHHLRRWGWWDGCYRGLRRGFVSAPLVVYAGPRRYWRRRAW